MEYRNLGTSGLRVSAIGLGCNNFGSRSDRDATHRVVAAALDAGITLFDTADIYPYPMHERSETYLGEALGKRRSEVIVATKFGLPMDGSGRREGASRRYIMSAVDDSLRRLNTDWIDLYQVHRFDPHTPIEETVRALDDLVRAGKVRYVGASNFAAWQFVDALWTAKDVNATAFIACQSEYSLLARQIEPELIPAMRAHGAGLLPYFPLASGLLTGKYRRGQAPPAGARLTTSERLMAEFLNDRNAERVEALAAFCERRSVPMLDVAIGWLLAQPVVASVIAGATSPEQIAQNVAAAGTWTPSAEDLAEIDRLTLSADGT